MDDTAPPDRPPSPPVPPPSRRPRDMVISLLVLLVPVVLFVGVYQVLSGRTRPVEVDPQPALAAAAAAGLEVSTPEGLSAGWVPVSAVFQPGEAGDTLRVGYVTPDGGSVQLAQSTVPPEQLLPGELKDPATPAGAVDLAGRPWQAYPPRAGERALVLLEPELTTIVRGTASEAELRDLATTLGPPPG
ncbi:MAG: DUF4245 family protein [Micromonosporaceae bacterium]|nr:DUF4245 family protein [Micromonosporaceae bacterium]